MRRKKIKEEINKINKRRNFFMRSALNRKLSLSNKFAQISVDNLVLRIYCAISQVRIHVYGI